MRTLHAFRRRRSSPLAKSVRCKVVSPLIIQVASDIHSSVGMTVVCSSCQIVVCYDTTSSLLFIWLLRQHGR